MEDTENHEKVHELTSVSAYKSEGKCREVYWIDRERTRLVRIEWVPFDQQYPLQKKNSHFDPVEDFECCPKAHIGSAAEREAHFAEHFPFTLPVRGATVTTFCQLKLGESPKLEDTFVVTLIGALRGVKNERARLDCTFAAIRSTLRKYGHADPASEIEDSEHIFLPGPVSRLILDNTKLFEDLSLTLRLDGFKKRFFEAFGIFHIEEIQPKDAELSLGPRKWAVEFCRTKILRLQIKRRVLYSRDLEEYDEAAVAAVDRDIRAILGSKDSLKKIETDIFAEDFENYRLPEFSFSPSNQSIPSNDQQRLAGDWVRLDLLCYQELESYFDPEFGSFWHRPKKLLPKIWKSSQQQRELSQQVHEEYAQWESWCAQLQEIQPDFPNQMTSGSAEDLEGTASDQAEPRNEGRRYNPGELMRLRQDLATRGLQMDPNFSSNTPSDLVIRRDSSQLQRPQTPSELSEITIPHEKLLSFAQFLRQHRSPHHHRVTAGGRIVKEPKMPPATFAPDFIDAFCRDGQGGNHGGTAIGTSRPATIVNTSGNVVRAVAPSNFRQMLHPKLEILPGHYVVEVLNQGKTATMRNQNMRNNNTVMRASLGADGKTTYQIMQVVLGENGQIRYEKMRRPGSPASRAEGSFTKLPSHVQDAHHNTYPRPFASHGNAYQVGPSTMHPPHSQQTSLQTLQGRSGFTDRNVEIHMSTSLAQQPPAVTQPYLTVPSKSQTYLDPAAAYSSSHTRNSFQHSQGLDMTRSSNAIHGSVGNPPQLGPVMSSYPEQQSSTDFQSQISHQFVYRGELPMEQLRYIISTLEKKSIELGETDKVLIRFSHILSRPEIDRLGDRKRQLVVEIDQLRKSKAAWDSYFEADPLLLTETSTQSGNPPGSRKSSSYASSLRRLDTQNIVAPVNLGTNIGKIMSGKKPLSPTAPSFIPTYQAYGMGQSSAQGPLDTSDSTYEAFKRSHFSEAGPSLNDQAFAAQVAAPVSSHTRRTSGSDILRSMLHVKEGPTQANETPAKTSFTWGRMDGESKEAWNTRCNVQRMALDADVRRGSRSTLEDENAPIFSGVGATPMAQETGNVASSIKGYKSPTSVAPPFYHAPGMVSRQLTSARESLMANNQVQEAAPNVSMRGGRPPSGNVRFRGSHRGQRGAARPYIGQRTFHPLPPRPAIPNFNAQRGYNTYQGPRTNTRPFNSIAAGADVINKAQEIETPAAKFRREHPEERARYVAMLDEESEDELEFPEPPRDERW